MSEYLQTEPMEQHEANIVVDFQNDFIDGSLAVNGATDIIENVINLSKIRPTIATQDSHPISHKSFASNNDALPGEVIQLNGVNQVLWPDHCVQGTLGWQLEPRFAAKGNILHTFFKGTDYDVDSYSAFFDNSRLVNEKFIRKSTGLHEHLHSKNVKRLYIFGLATDYCVKYTVLDALTLGYKVYFVQDASAAINLNKGDGERAIAKMEELGANVVGTDEVIDMQ